MGRKILFVIGLVVGATGVFIFLNQSYKGKTARQWESIAVNNANIIDTMSKQIKQLESQDQHDQQLLQMALNPTRNPSPSPSESTVQTVSELPSWCYEIIQDYTNRGYSRSVTNQLLKKNNPECSF